MVRNLPAIQETWVKSLDGEDPLKEEMATHSSIPAWRIPWTEEPGGFQSMGLKRVGHDWVANTYTFPPVQPPSLDSWEFSSVQSLAPFNFMAAVTICSDFGAQKIKSVIVCIVSPSICHEVVGPDAMIFVFWMVSFKPVFHSFTFIKRLFSSSSLSAMRLPWWLRR